MCAAKWLGPDWTDVRTALDAVGFSHEAELSVVLEPLGREAGPGLHVSVVATWPEAQNKSSTSAYVGHDDWPNSSDQAIESVVYQLILRVDFELGAVRWAQTVLPEG